MQTFKDKRGRMWNIDIDAVQIARIAHDSEGRWDMQKVLECTDASATEDLCDVYELLWYVIKPQAEERQITAEQFAIDITDALGLFLIRARHAFWQSWADYFPTNDPKRLALLKLIETSRKLVAHNLATHRERKHGRRRR